jgi:hypothetical protein
MMLKDKPKRIKRIPLFIITVTIILLEAIRQIVALAKGYTADNLPLYLCSLFIPMFALASFSKCDSKLSKIGYSFSLIIGLPIAISIVLMPSIAFDLQIYGSAIQNIFTQNAVFRHYHSFFYHILAVFFIALCIVLKLYKPKKCDMIPAFGAFFSFILTSTIISKLVTIDYIRIWSFPLNIPVPILVILYQIIPLIGGVLSIMLPSFLTTKK